LAEKHAPVVRLVEQDDQCGHGEPYVPIDVARLLGNNEVVFRGPWDTVNVVKVAPTEAELDASRVDYHLDFPGNPLDPGCDYERFGRRALADSLPTTYARVVTEAGKAGRLALQYWFFYVFNDWNNKHEGDWEMVQLVFDADDASDALTKAPSIVGYSQHEGAEQTEWGDEKLEIVDGARPVVYPAAGSHANFYSPALYLGRSAAEGVGCDDTRGPHREIRPVVAAVPSAVQAYLAEYPWLEFPGRWGEKQPNIFNGPTGPNQKAQWTKPITWAEQSWRDQSFAVPAGAPSGRLRPTSSVARSPRARASSPASRRTRRRSCSPSAAWSCCCSGPRQGRTGSRPHRCGSHAAGPGGSSSRRRVASTRGTSSPSSA
jgi:hypothetical protein